MEFYLVLWILNSYDKYKRQVRYIPRSSSSKSEALSTEKHDLDLED